MSARTRIGTSKEPDVTQLLKAWSGGDRAALDALVAAVYDELRRLAHARRQRENPDHTYHTTALIHEAYIRLVDIERVEWVDRAHFLAVASRTMRRVLVDYGRKRRAEKRGGGMPDLPLHELDIPDEYTEAVMDLDDALSRLEAISPRQCQVVEQRYFGGLSLEETAAVLDVSLATVKRDLQFARAWLARELKDKPPL